MVLKYPRLIIAMKWMTENSPNPDRAEVKQCEFQNFSGSEFQKITTTKIKRAIIEQ